jgi:cytochrome c oxidase subunit 2
MQKTALILFMVLFPFFTACEKEKKDIQNLKLTGEKKQGVRIIHLKAFQFGYEPETITVKKGEKVRIIAVSTDVAHGFAVDKMNIGEEIIPKRENIIEFTANKEGSFQFYCNIYCGTGHSSMNGTLVVKGEQ